jgi:eukaryotic-like serine/threonine-protein kinase
VVVPTAVAGGSPPDAEPGAATDSGSPPKDGTAPRKRAPAILAVKDALRSLKTPPASSGEGILAVVATPWANVTINGRAIGETPREVRVVAGTYRLRATHPTLGSSEAQVTVAAGTRKLWNATLSK